MGKIMFAPTNYVDSAIITASSEVANLPASNLAIPRIGKVWRTSAASAYVDFDFGADVPIDVVAFAQPNDSAVMLAATDTVRHQFDADGGTPGTGAVEDSGVIATGIDARYGLHFWQPSGSFSARYWRLTVSAAALTYFDLGRPYAGPAWQPVYDFGGGISVQWIHGGRDTAYGEKSLVPFADTGARARLVTIPFDVVHDGDRANFENLFADMGRAGQMFVCLDPDNPARNSLFGRMPSVPEIAQELVNLHRTQITLREDR